MREDFLNSWLYAVMGFKILEIPNNNLLDQALKCYREPL